MKLSTAKRRINKTLDELTQSVIDDWYANFKNGYIKGYTDARQGKAPMYAEAYKVADTPQTDCPFKDVPCSCGEQDECEWHTELDAPQTDCKTCRHYKLACELFSEVCKYEPTTQTETQNSNLTFDTPQTESTGSPIGDYRDGVGAWQTDCGWGEPNED